MQTTIRNNTRDILEIQGAEDQLIRLAPLEQRRVDDLSGFDLSRAIGAGMISKWNEPPSDLVEKVFPVAGATGVMIAILCGMVTDERRFGISEENWPAAVWGVWGTGAVILLVAVGALVIYHTKSLRLVMRFVTQIFSLFAILAIGLGLPLATVYYFGDGKTLLNTASPELFVRLLQVAFIATASLLPVLLYFLFDRYQLGTIREGLYRDLFRLDHSLKTRSEIDARFGSQIREAYGPEDQGGGRLAPGTRWPVLVCAFVVTVGWLMAFRPIGEVDAALRENPLFTAPQNAWTYGFLGAYFFGLQLISRRYARGDLKPKAYGYITVRILIVAVLSWVLEAVFPQAVRPKLVIAFLTGIVPDEFFTFLREQFRGRAPARLVPETEKHPLTRLEGIDLYDRARLEQEGIVNVEGLAHHELIHLVLEASAPVPRLVDWLDQAILYLHVIQDSDDNARQRLRSFGIRTATDLLTCWEAAESRGEIEAFKKLLDGDNKPSRLEVICDALRDDEWLNRVRDWRKDFVPETAYIEAVPRSLEARLGWADVLVKQNRYNDAIRALQGALEVRDDAEVRVRLARIFATVPVLSLRNTNSSREHAQRAFVIGERNFEVLSDLITINEVNEDWADAARACEAAIQALGEPGSDRDKQDALKALRERRDALMVKAGESLAPSFS